MPDVLDSFWIKEATHLGHYLVGLMGFFFGIDVHTFTPKALRLGVRLFKVLLFFIFCVFLKNPKLAARYLWIMLKYIFNL